MNVYSIALDKYHWSYRLWGTSLTAHWFSDIPMPTNPGMYLVNNGNTPLIFHLVEINENGAVAQMMYLRELILRKWC